MGLFDFFKKKQKEQKMVQENYILLYFGEINLDNLEEYYSANFDLNNTTIRTDLNFANQTIKKDEIKQIEAFLNNSKDLDKNNKAYIENDFNSENGETSEYLNFYLEELDEEELSEIIDLQNHSTPKNIQLLKKLQLIRIGFYPDGKYGTDHFATFDYSIEINGEPCNQLLVVNTDRDGKLDRITWES